jgi:hypothetical protein
VQKVLFSIVRRERMGDEMWGEILILIRVERMEWGGIFTQCCSARVGVFLLYFYYFYFRMSAVKLSIKNVNYRMFIIFGE